MDPARDLLAELKAHERWLERPTAGSRLDWSGLTLEQDLDLQCRVLDRALLHSTNFGGVFLRGAQFRGAALRFAKLDQIGDPEYLQAQQFAGANLRGAIFPREFRCSASLSEVRDASRSARKLFLGILIAALYCWIILAVTSGAKLFTDVEALPLPVLSTNIPLNYFYWFGPVLLLGSYTYYLIYLQRFWERLADLPAVFPDGRPVHKVIHPWLPSGFVFRYFKRLRDPVADAAQPQHQQPAGTLLAGPAWFSDTAGWLLRNRPRDLSHLPALHAPQVAICFFVTWMLVPLTLLGFWYRWLPKHDVLGSSFQWLAFSAATALALVTWNLTCTTLGSLHGWTAFPRGFAIFCGALVIPSLAVMTLALTTSLAPSAQGFLERTKLAPSIDLYGAELSVKPREWTGRAEGREALMDLVKPAHLSNAYLKGVRARSAFLVRADLAGADLGRADLRNADLGGADLTGAILTRAQLANARMDSTVITNAEGVDFSGLARGFGLRFAHMAHAALKGADLSGVDLSGADLAGASLDAVNLAGARLNGATGLTIEALQRSSNWILAYYGTSTVDDWRRQPDHDRNVAGKVFDGYDLSRLKLESSALGSAKLRDAILRGTSFDLSDLSSAQFSGADLRDATFRKARIDAADFRKAGNLRPAQVRDVSRGWVLAFFDRPDQFIGDLCPDPLRHNVHIALKDLSRHNLSNLDFRGMQLNGFNLRRANFEGAQLAGTNFRDADATDAIFDAHALSQGQIESFRQGSYKQ